MQYDAIAMTKNQPVNRDVWMKYEKKTKLIVALIFKRILCVNIKIPLIPLKRISFWNSRQLQIKTLNRN